MGTFRPIYYDCFSKIYDRFVAFHSSDRQGHLRGYLAKKTGVASGDRVLDICTGTGSLLSALASRISSHGLVVGIDFSRGMLSVAKRKTGMDRSIHLIQADASFLPFKKNVFDAVTCAHAFYELRGRSQQNCLHEVLRVLKAGKPFLMMEHEVPTHRFVRLLFYIRLFSSGTRRALEIIKAERQFMERYFKNVRKIVTPTGHSKIWICYDPNGGH
jgi:demethylmenaquinone methyltransferase/2-methoxy-6-polyprenyl-1,4-benzoquinol methylase